MDYSNFKWNMDTESTSDENGIHIYAREKTNYFVNPIDGSVETYAPFFYQEVEGDFVLRSKVSHDFTDVYDACILLAFENEHLWAKACFEYTDIGTHSVVTVMTNQTSDDANGVNIEGNQVWLQLARKDNVFAVHYSLDGENYKMARICSLPMQKKIQVGLAAQSPVGKGGVCHFEDVVLEQRTLCDIRGGK